MYKKTHDHFYENLIFYILGNKIMYYYPRLQNTGPGIWNSIQNKINFSFPLLNKK